MDHPPPLIACNSPYLYDLNDKDVVHTAIGKRKA
jgi:hypothetical protein